VSERTALYRLFDAKNTLLYIGISKRFGVRWQQHAKVQPWWPQVDHQTVHWHPDRETAEAAEVAAIKSERPLHNVMHAVAAPQARSTLRELKHSSPVLAKVAITGSRLQRHQRENAAHIADVLAALKAGHRPTDVTEWSAFTATYIRKLAREAGIPPARRGGSGPRRGT
jgi:predicted GIY-YIG superfamily endonuclease